MEPSVPTSCTTFTATTTTAATFSSSAMVTACTSMVMHTFSSAISPIVSNLGNNNLAHDTVQSAGNSSTSALAAPIAPSVSQKLNQSGHKLSKSARYRHNRQFRKRIGKVSISDRLRVPIGSDNDAVGNAGGSRSRKSNDYSESAPSTSDHVLPIMNRSEKRGRMTSSTPPNNSNPPKRSKLYAEVTAESALKIGVVDTGSTSGIDPDKQVILLRVLQIKISEAVDEKNFIPRLRGNFISKGMLIFKCADELTKKWLIDTIGELDTVWDGSNLEVVDDLRLTKYRIWIPGPPENPDKVLKTLERLNPGLDTVGWRVFSHNTKDAMGQSLVVGVTSLSLPYLEGFDFSLQHYFDAIDFKTLGLSNIAVGISN